MISMITEKDLIYEIAQTNGQKLNPSIPIIFKGIAGKTLNMIPPIAGAIVGVTLEKKLQNPYISAPSAAFVQALTDQVIQEAILKKIYSNDTNYYDTKLHNILISYSKNLYHGDSEGNKFKKDNAYHYYKEALNNIMELDKHYRNSFSENWVIELLQADINSHIGSICSDQGKFKDAKEWFNESNFIIKELDSNLYPCDKILEYNTYRLSNSMRSEDGIRNELLAGDFDEYDSIAIDLEKSYFNLDKNVTFYSKTIVHDMIFELEKNPKLNVKIHEYKEKIRSISDTINNRKLQYTLGKYWAVRGCYNFIEFHFNKNLEDKKINTENQIIYKGMYFMVNSYLESFEISLSPQNTLNEYLNNSLYYYSNIQKSLARNFTILYGLGVDSNDNLLKEKYEIALTLLYRKERKKNNNGVNTLWDSVKTADIKVLKPYGLDIDYLGLKHRIECRSETIKRSIF